MTLTFVAASAIVGTVYPVHSRVVQTAPAVMLTTDNSPYIVVTVAHVNQIA